MTKGNLRRVLFSSIMLCMAIPGLAIADGGPKAGDGPNNCSFQGTWFGVISPEILTLTGWVVTVEGKSHDSGTNNLEYPTFNPTLPDASGVPTFPAAVRISTLRGAWERTGRNTFAYSFMGFGLDSANAPVYIAKVNGTIELSGDCGTEAITASMSVYYPANVSPFDGAPLFTIPLPKHYGYRY
jgi:hypothetical protein